MIHVKRNYEFTGLLCSPNDPTAKKLTNQNHFSLRKVSISKPLFFNAHEIEAAKFISLLWFAAATPAGLSDNIYLQVKVVFCYK